MSWRDINWCEHKYSQQASLKKTVSKVYKNCSNINFFNPFLLEFSLYNNKNKRLNHRYILSDIINLENIISIRIRIFKSRLWDVKKKKYCIKQIITKELPILPPDNYLQLSKNEIGDLNEYQYNVYNNSLSFNNPSIVELIVNYLTSNIYENKLSPHFVLYYGSINIRIPKFTFEDDLCKKTYIKSEKIKYFPKNKKIQIKDYPITILSNEYVPLRLSDLLENTDYDIDLWSSFIFQIACAVNLIWNKYKICHNDLHIYNINYKRTPKKYIYYQHPYLKNKYYKLPTFGIILKIFDWGRSSFKWNNQWINSEVFSPEGEAFGQYYFQRHHKSNKKKILPRSGTDLILFIYSLISNSIGVENDILIKNLIKITNDPNLLSKKNIDFNLYINITHRKNITPTIDILSSKFFNKYLVDEIEKNVIVYKIK